MSPDEWIAARKAWRRELHAMLPPLPNCRCYLPPQETTMITVYAIGRRERDGMLFAIVNTKAVPAGVEHSFTFGAIDNKALVRAYAPFGGDEADLPRALGVGRERYTWVRLADICPIPVQHLVEYEGRIAAVVDARDVPRDVMRSQARWVGLDTFTANNHPAEAKDVRYQGPTHDALGPCCCWMFLDQLWGVPHAPAGAKPVMVKDSLQDGYTVLKGMNGDVVRVRNLRVDSCITCGAPATGNAGMDRYCSACGPIAPLSREECFRRYAEAQTSERMREDGSGDRGTLLNTRVRELALTPAQLTAAREVWSEKLREKTQASEAAAKLADAHVVGWDPYEDD